MILPAASWQEQAEQCFLEGNYVQAANFYEQAIANEPENISHYWYLGLMLLLQEKEAEAQMIWLCGMESGEAAKIPQLSAELTQVLQTEAQRREALADDRIAWVIRQYIREVNPLDINNLLRLILLAIKLETFTGEELHNFGVIEVLQATETINVDFSLLMEVLQQVLAADPLHPATLEFTAVCLPYVKEPYVFIDILVVNSVKIAYSRQKAAVAARLLEVALNLDKRNPEVLILLTSFYQDSGEYAKGIETAKLCYSLFTELPEKIFANHLIIRGLMMAAGKYWLEASTAFGQHESLLNMLFNAPELNLDPTTVVRLFSATYFLPYFRDDLKSNRNLQNQVARICQINIQNNLPEQTVKYAQIKSIKSPNKTTKKLKIGYLSHCLKRHSVGWIARWLLKYHDRDRFQVHAYLINAQQRQDPLQEWYVNQVDKAYKFGLEATEIAEQIYQDEIDILIDLDSITLDVISEITTLKPAPIQVTWLGWDASGIPAIDYFIVDPYVLPETAQEYYSETLWKLPETYLAVDGFEVGVPTLRRDSLEIPQDAVVYFSSQMGFKRHPETVHLQMQILKQVPNSYFLIKGSAEQLSIKNFFTEIAEAEGVSSDRLRFLPDVAFEEIHRANLGIADIVLDTYPYNGATTTLETLWMGIPLVTKVGEQFASRNSYTMMMNVGVTEGIAWTDEEYVEWGVRLGKDAALRQKIAWQLRQSRQTSPLWNGKQFTREMETAFKQMWARYIQS
ncbi:O-linked N-acetylglucosamine transferase, SPINDLY family protein [Phormidium sp. LEGE 05292]|uniref:O-linked N-acetylglucosamine transferase, SPINDLY family protein n=1 Tax=[Phormidium] sp. LEGE 05292 TaxID=767427 RepID=UPI0018810CD8|nr:O-linked N-acetylglucosamine transferase, SPINDLY family protein [Phormidium sp. LEGE 05292]MBE9224310.1 O-linked N-acetylglucosamine transferase, SPINDLY family protein [Phormidium sp. LEGE 05292]